MSAVVTDCARESRSTASAVPGSAPGLSTCHIRPPSLKVWVGGSLLKCSVPRWTPERDPDKEVQRAKRGKISIFSAGSRRRLLRALASTQRKAKAGMITLTYPQVWDANPKAWKGHLRAFVRRLNRRYPEICGFWKLEFQRRGAPHFHLVCWGMPAGEGTHAFEELIEFVSKAWYQVVKSGDLRHLYAGTRCELIRSEKGIMAYAAKYVGKPETLETSGVGRWWGSFNVDKIPYAEAVEVMGIDKRAGFALLRAMRRYAGIRRARGHGRYGLTIFCDGTFWARRIPGYIESIENEPF